MSDVAPPRGAIVQNQVLLGGVRQLDIDYYGAADGQAPRWRTLWYGQTSPPQVVRIRLAFEPGDARVWPDLMVHPRATIDTSCLLDPQTHRCKGRA